MLSLDQQNKFREQYRQINPGWRPATEVYSELVRSRLDPASRLLDLGCGRGGLVEQIHQPLEYIVGLDPDWESLSEHRLAKARPPLPRVVGVNGELPFGDGTFDLVIASWVLEHLPTPLADFKQIRRLLNPDGSFIFITPNRRHPLISLNRLSARYTSLQKKLVQGFYGRRSEDTFPAYYRANSAGDLKMLAAGSGMNLVKLDIIADPTYFAFSPAFFSFSLSIERRLPKGHRIHLVGEIQLAD
jgi:SAM-dependent methyltransferase